MFAMKKNVRVIVVILIAILSLAIGISLVLCLIPEEGMNSTLRSILYEIDKGLILTGIIGFVISFASRLIAEDILAVSRDNKRLRKLGIKSISDKKFNKEEVRLMFGDDKNGYPIELKFLFVSGINFVKDYRPLIIKAIEHGSVVKIMIGDPVSDEGKRFLEHNQQFRGERNANGLTDIQECEKVTEMLKEIHKEVTDKQLPGSLSLRYYTDQYRCNHRIAIYENNKKREYRVWTNLSPQTKIAIDLTLAVYGTYNEGDYSESLVKTDEENNSLVLATDKSFDKLWDICNQDIDLTV